MGNEGALLGVMADLFMEANPNVTVNVTPVDWGQAVTKLQTAIGGGETPDVSQMGTDMMGQFVETGRLEPVGAGFDPSAVLRERVEHQRRRRRRLRRPVVRRDPRPLRADRPRERPASRPPRPPGTSSRPRPRRCKDGGAEYGISLGTKNSQEYLPFVWRTAATSSADGRHFTLDSPEAIEALTFYDSFFEEGLSPNVRARGLRHHAGLRRRHPPDVLLRPVARRPHHRGRRRGHRGQVGRLAPCPAKATRRPRSSAAATSSSSRTATNKDAAWAFVEFMSRPETQVAWYEEATVLPAVQSAWDDPALPATRTWPSSASSSTDTKAPPAISDLERGRDRDQRQPGAGHDRRHRRPRTAPRPCRRPPPRSARAS